MRKSGSIAKPKQTGVFFYAPVTFDPYQIHELRGLESAALWLVHKIICGSIYRRHDPYHDGMTHISRQTMQRFIAKRHVTSVRNVLIAKKILVCDESYRVSDEECQGYSQSYALHPDHAGEIERVECTSKPLAAKVRAYRIAVGNKAVKVEELDRTRQHLENTLRRVHIDTDKAYLINSLDDSAPKIVSRKIKIRNKTKKRVIKVAMPSTQMMNRLTIDSIALGEWEFDTCRYGRVHTNITRLATACRDALSIDGQQLQGIDIRNSQLVFLSLLLMERMLPADGGKMTVLRESTAEYSSTFPTASHDIIEVHSTDETENGVVATPYEGTFMIEEKDVQDFIQQTMEGAIYDLLMIRTGYKPDQRKEFKGKFFEQVLYGDNDAYYSRSSPIVRAFKEAFPTVWEWIKEVKRQDFKELARDMQRRESRFMIGRCCGRLAEHYPEVPLVTIHDSILTLPEYLPTVRRVVEEEFARIGVRPAMQ